PVCGVVAHRVPPHPFFLEGPPLFDPTDVAWPTRVGRPTDVGRVDAEMARIERRAGGYGIRLSLAEVKGISEEEVIRIVAGQCYSDLADFWQRARVSRPVVERLVLAGAFDELHAVGAGRGVRRSGPTRRDLLLHVAELDRWSRQSRGGAGGGRSRRGSTGRGGTGRGGQAPPPALGEPVDHRAESAARVDDVGAGEVAARTVAQSQGTRSWHARPAAATQLALDLGDEPRVHIGSGLPEMTPQEQTTAELEVLGMDVSAHVTTTYRPMLQELGVTPADRLLERRNHAEVLIAGAKVATQTPPVRSGRRVVFLTLDDGTGPSDATFFEDVQGPYAGLVFHSWLLVVRGVLRRTGPRGRSVRATAAWEMTHLAHVYDTEGIEAVRAVMDRAEQEALAGAAGEGAQAGRRVLVHASGFRQSPYADVAPAGTGARERRAVGKLWHSSPGSSGW
ncbi:MAG: OB-fold nucleic acid binding domain-containing protein, partial [Ornithinimicrobium sp.]|uniref:helix-hairpin-helix domain-containing protein n=1 Tax=Ornithinimicrobium sp. TaxID=1977084 RepID=UPI003D9B4A16